MDIKQKLIRRAEQYHCDHQKKRGYPCGFQIGNPEDYIYFPADKPALVCQRPANQDLPFLAPHVIRALTIIGSGIEPEPFLDMLRTYNRPLSFIVEDYNRPAVLLLDKMGARETEYCQKKLLGRIDARLLDAPLDSSNARIRNFIPGQDEMLLVEYYNRVLGYLGSYVDITFIKGIVRRPSFNPEGYFLAEAGGGPVGFLNVEIEPWGTPDSGFAYIYQIGVDDDLQGTGLASALLARAGRFAARNGCDRLGVGVRNVNARGTNFFLKNGFNVAYRVTGYTINGREIC